MKIQLKLLFPILLGLIYTTTSIAATSNTDFKKVPVSKLFLECYLNGETIYKSGSEIFKDRISVKLESEYVIFENIKNLWVRIETSGGNDIADFYVYGINNEKTYENNIIRFSDDEYDATSNKFSGYISSITINRHTGFINYFSTKKGGGGFTTKANGKCDKVKDRKF